MNLKIMAWSWGCQAYFFIFYLSCSGVFFTQHSMLRPLNPTTYHCRLSRSHWFTLSQLQWQCPPPPPPAKLLPPGFPPGFASLGVGPVSSFCSQYRSAHGFRIQLSLLKTGSDFLGFAQLDSWSPFLRSLCWHRQLPPQIRQVPGNSTRGGTSLPGPWWSHVSWQPNGPSTSGPILEKDVSW